MNKKVKIGIASVLLVGLGAGGYQLTRPETPSIQVVYNFPLGFDTVDSETNISFDGLSAYDYFVDAAEEEEFPLAVEWYDFDGDGSAESAFIAAVNDLTTSDDWTQWWQFSVNNELALFGISDYVPVDGDVISLDYKDGVGLDALEWLVDNQNGNGSLGNTFFQDAFGLMALGEYEGTEVSTARDRAIRHVRRVQRSDASFGDNLYTAVGTMALLNNGLSLDEFSKADTTSIDILFARQMDDGGWNSGTAGSDVDTTSWVVMAIAKAGYDVPESAIDYLLSAQHQNGSWGYNAVDASSSVEYTEEALLALSAANYPADQRIDAALGWLGTGMTLEGCYTDGFTTALGSLALRAWGEESGATLVCLETFQNGDGSFGRNSNPSNAMDTGLALWVLEK